MKNLSPKEEQIMNYFWEHGAMFVKEVCTHFPEPKPHYNTVSTFIRLMEEKGLLTHTAVGTSHRYAPTVTKEAYSLSGVKSFMNRFFAGSPKQLVSALVEEESISIDELKDLIRQVESQSK